MFDFMRPLLILALTLKLGLVLGQPLIGIEFPVIKNEGQTMESFIPECWTVVDSTKGDLNGDNELDIAFAIKSKDSLTSYSFIEFEGEQRVHKMEVEKYPRSILIVALKQPGGNNFSLIEQSNSIISGLASKIQIDNRLLKIEYHSDNMERNFSNNTKYFFSYQNEQLVLIKVKRFELYAGWTQHFILDFSSQKLELTKGKLNAEKQNIIWKNLEPIQPKTMRDFESPYRWYITEGIYI